MLTKSRRKKYTTFLRLQFSCTTAFFLFEKQSVYRIHKKQLLLLTLLEQHLAQMHTQLSHSQSEQQLQLRILKSAAQTEAANTPQSIAQRTTISELAKIIYQRSEREKKT
jgi:hypothetical protein